MSGRRAAPRTKKRKPVIVKILLWVLVILVVACIGVVVFANVILDKIDRSKITGDENLSYADILGEDYQYSDESDSTEEMSLMQKALAALTGKSYGNIKGVENILLIGSDRRSQSENGRSDSMIILSINHDTKKFHLTSLERAMYVCVPKSSGDTWGMLNAAYSWGGPELLIQTIELNLKTEIDHYVIVDFTAFQSCIDIVGGVDVELTKAEADYVNAEVGSSFSAGVETLNGEAALSYARARKIDNDFHRTDRQRTVIMALMKEAMRSSVSELTDIANEILPLINTDMKNSEMLAYVADVGNYAKYDIDQMMLPVENQDYSYTGKIYVGGMEMYQYDVEKNIAALREFIAN